MSGLSSVRELYNTNKLVKFCTNWTAILAFVAICWQSTAWAVERVDDYFAKAADVRALQKGQGEQLEEQRALRGLVEKQGRQLDFIYYDTMKREKSNLDREIFELRSRSRSALENARLEQLQDDVKDLKRRIQAQELLIRGQ